MVSFGNHIINFASIFMHLYFQQQKNLFIPKILQHIIDGIPLKEAVSLSNTIDFLGSGPFLHLYLHAKGE
jgi:hypothetical protein